MRGPLPMEHKRREASAGGSDVARKALGKVLASPDIRLGPYREHIREMMRSLLDLLGAGKDCVHEGFVSLQARRACLVGVQDSPVGMGLQV